MLPFYFDNNPRGNVKRNIEKNRGYESLLKEKVIKGEL